MTSDLQVCLSHVYRYLGGETGVLDWDHLRSIPGSTLPHMDDIDRERYSRIGEAHLSSLGVLKLNGGLGTSMGCSGPKSLLDVMPGSTFLDIIVQQMDFFRDTYSVSLPLILMNSFSTHAATTAALSNRDDILSFCQNQFPRIDAHTHAPFRYPEDPSQEWYPPGHGDVYLSLLMSGMLDRLIDMGVDTLFISNSDNLGAVIDPVILGYMIEHKHHFMMEVTPKTDMDVKGGTVVHYHGRKTLLERAQVPNSHILDFEDTTVFSVFNTNNLWVSLPELKQVLNSKNGLRLPLIVNPKNVNGHDVIQLETAMGAAISVFDHSEAIVVNRDRFLPVKKTSDLMVLQSDMVDKSVVQFRLASDIGLKRYPTVTLSEHFTSVDAYQARVESPPSLKKCRSLSLDGDISIGEGVVFEGDVTVKTSQKCHLEKQTISGLYP